MLSFNNDPALKEKFVKLAKEHREKDMLLAGTYSTVDSKGKFKGCSVGCFAYDIQQETVCTPVYTKPHSIVSNYFHIPQWLVRAQDIIFEYLPENERVDWHIQFAEAIPVGVDLNPIYNKSIIMRFERLLEKIADEDASLLLKMAIEIHEKILKGVSVSDAIIEIETTYKNSCCPTPFDDIVKDIKKQKLIEDVCLCIRPTINELTAKMRNFGRSITYSVHVSMYQYRALNVQSYPAALGNVVKCVGQEERDAILYLLKNS